MYYTTTTSITGQLPFRCRKQYTNSGAEPYTKDSIMSGEQFVAHLRRAMPDRETLEEYGLDPDEVADIQATFVAHARTSNGFTASNEIEQMLADFDCSKVEVGLVRFLERGEGHSLGKVFAFCEADRLILRPDGAIVMLPHSGTGGEIRCAASPAQFLDAIALFADMIADKSAWKGKTNIAAERCATAAGVPSDGDFYRLLCGFFE